jgi:hypothetical protein
MRKPLLITASLTALFAAASLPAQVLIYDNGPLQTGVGNGFGGANTSTLQTMTPNLGNIIGYGAQEIGPNRVADDFHISVGATINQVEVWAFQNPGTTVSSFTGLWVNITAGDPSTGAPPVPGSPGFTVNLYAGGLISHVFSGIYRVVDTNLLNSAWPLIRIRCALPSPIVLGPGTYWITYSLTGTIASGPWIAPVTILNALNSGNGKQFQGGTGIWVTVENCQTTGCGNGSAFPFRLYGSGQVPGSITDGVVGCAAATLSVEGAPVLGGVLRVEMRNLTPTPNIPVLGFDFAPVSVPVCFNGTVFCTAGHFWSFAFAFQTAMTLSVPMNPGLKGVTLACQGAEFSGVGACASPSPTIAFTNSRNVTLQF